MSSISEAMSNATMQFEAGRFQVAEKMLQQILASQPNHFDALQLLGQTFAHSRQFDQALECMQKAIKINPESAATYRVLGHILESQNKKMQALDCYSHALILDSNDLESQLGSADLFQELGQLENAALGYRRSILLSPNDPMPYFNLGRVLHKQGNFGESIPCYQQAIHLKPDFVEALCNLGKALQKHSGLEYAVPYFQQALALNPDHAESKFQLSMAWLQLGHFAAGWPDFESRIKVRKLHEFRSAKWDGSPLAGRRILLYAEQGFRDTIQFIRYAKLVKDAGGQVIVACQPELLPLLKSFQSIDILVPQPKSPLDSMPRFDLYLHLLSLPGLFGTSLETIPNQVPYLSADSQLAAQWSNVIESKTKLKVGLAWQGNHSPSNDRNRSIRLEEFEPLGKVAGVKFFSLQMGAGSEQIDYVAGRLNVMELEDQVDPSIDVFSQVAAMIKNLDLVITSDTSIAHLAGALGVPVWVALSHFPDWRWLHGRDDTPWYPSMRLFRQEVLGDWSSAFRKMAAALRDFALPAGAPSRHLKLNLPETIG